MNHPGKWVWASAAIASCATIGGCAATERNLKQVPRSATRPLLVELLALDLSTCGRCTGTDRNMQSAVTKLKPLLADADVDLQFRKTVVRSAEQAAALRFRSSPTIRINGRDLPIELRESRCGDCAAIAGGSTCSVDCRVWVWRGREYTEAPTGLVIDAILRAYAEAWDSSPPPIDEPFELPENLKQFFVARANVHRGAAAPCCAGGPSSPLGADR